MRRCPPRAVSSVGQSRGLIILWSLVRSQHGLPESDFGGRFGRTRVPEAGFDAVANAEICLSALHDLRAALSSEVAASRELSIRCDSLQAMLREARRSGS